jgi:hypothetical protein
MIDFHGSPDGPVSGFDGSGSLSLLHRRHLDESQRAMVGARAKPMFEEEARARQAQAGGDRRTEALRANLPEAVQQHTGRARDKAAAQVNVSPRSVEYATKVIASGAPELIAAVDGPVHAFATQHALARCDREQAEIELRASAGDIPAWLVALGRNDWEWERRAILRDAAAGQRDWSPLIAEMNQPIAPAPNVVTSSRVSTIGDITIHITEPGADVDQIKRAVLDAIREKEAIDTQVEISQLTANYA